MVGMSVPPSDVADDAWRPVIDAIEYVVDSAHPIPYDMAHRYAEWAWLDDPFPDAIEKAALEVAAANCWEVRQTRVHVRKLYYEALRQYRTENLAPGVRVPDWEELPPPIPVLRLREQATHNLSWAQLGYLHAQGQVIADGRDLGEDGEHKWRHILDTRKGRTTDGRNLEGPIAPLEQCVSSFVDGTIRQMPAPPEDSGRILEAAARRALYQAYWYRLNVRADRLPMGRASVADAVAATRSQVPSGGPKPEALPYGVSHQGAEQLCADWLTHLGATNVSVTRASGDGGVDIVSDAVIAQVKNYTGTVGVEEIRAFHGVASVDRRTAVFFTSGQYASGAVTFADLAQMPLLVYDAVAGTLAGANERGRALRRDGLCPE